jgi:uncharacterized protein YceH (UPF0502 family)
MEIILTCVEARVLGSLIEKEMSTPDYYPLTLNALTSACNQKSNRDPVMNLEEQVVTRALESLIQKHLAWQRNTAEGRVPKYAHGMYDIFRFSPAELGTICVLLLRGPQTPGEIRSRTARLYEYEDLAEVEATLQQLAEPEDDPFVVKLPRQPGCRENRYAHLFCGEVKVDDAKVDTQAATISHGEVTIDAGAGNERLNDRIDDLERKVADLRLELDELKQMFTRFTQQFE